MVIIITFIVIAQHDLLQIKYFSHRTLLSQMILLFCCETGVELPSLIIKSIFATSRLLFTL